MKPSILGIFYIVPYALCMIAMSKPEFRNYSAFKLMLAMGLVDIVQVKASEP